MIASLVEPSFLPRAAKSATEALEGVEPLLLLVPIGILAALAFALLRPARRVEDRLMGPLRPAPDVYQWRDVVSLAGLFVISQLVLVIYAQGQVNGPGAAEAKPPTEFELTFIEMVWAGLGMFALMSIYIVAVSFGRRGGVEALGLRARTPARVFGGRSLSAIGRYLTVLPAFYLTTLLLVFAYTLLGQELPVQEVAVDIQEHLDKRFLLIVLFAVVLQPLFEEILFRGFLLELLGARFGMKAGVVISSVVFGVLHGSAVVPITALAFALAWIKLRTGSLWSVFLVHAIHNGAQITIASFALESTPPA